jgi:hypothetical protein
MTLFKVIWEIHIEADSELEAAQKAKEIQMDTTSMANFFTVKNPETKEECEINLNLS